MRFWDSDFRSLAHLTGIGHTLQHEAARLIWIRLLTEAGKTKTAFKHPNCGGVILQCEKDGVVYFQCDECTETAEDIGSLVLRTLVIIRKGSVVESK